MGWTGGTYYVTAFIGRRDRLHRIFKRWHDFTGPENRILGWRNAVETADSNYDRRTVSALLLGPILIQLNNSSTVYEKVAAEKLTGFQVPEQELLREDGQLKSEKIPGFLGTTDTANYRVWHNTDARRGDPGRYLVNTQGQPVYLVDPGINGTVEKVQTGVDEAGNPVYQTVGDLALRKRTLMSYIIKGILSQELPWGLVLLGVMIAVALELCGISSLAFAVGLYLPISASAPIFVGGIVRWAVDLYLRRKLARKESDRRRNHRRNR